MGRGNKLLTSLPTTVFGETFLHLLLFHLISFCKGHLEWYHDMWWELRTKRFINAVFAAILDTFKPVFVTNLFYWGWYFTLLLGCVGCSSGEFGVRFLAIFPDQAEVACGAPCIAAGETVSGVRWNPVWKKKKKKVSGLYKARKWNVSGCAPSYCSEGKSSLDDVSLDCPE